MKRLLTLALAGLMMLSLGACNGASPSQPSGSTGQAPSEAGSAPQEDKVYQIGVVQLMEHESLDEAYQGFVDGLAENGYVDGKNIKLIFENAQNEQANCVTIADKLVNDKCDLILAIATPAAQAVANRTQDIPIVITAVTDAADAKLVLSNEKPGTNVTGTSDLTPVKEQLSLLKRLVPDAKKIALLYCSSEANSSFQIAIAKKEAEALGLETIEATVSNANEIQQVMQSLVGKVDAVYIPTDNTIAGSMPSVAMVAEPAKLPVIVGVEGMVDKGGLATYGINYYNLGKLTAQKAIAVLNGADPAETPIEYLTDCNLYIDEDMAQKIGVTIPDDLKAQNTWKQK